MRRMLDINVMGTLYANQAAFRYLREKGGSIINFTSESGIRGQRNSAHYSASKGAVAAWTQGARGYCARANPKRGRRAA
jgi:NAD(P)-dependent dehydrogenase (short-subunit alcohol dehydrogenase family)